MSVAVFIAYDGRFLAYKELEEYEILEAPESAYVLYAETPNGIMNVPEGKYAVIDRVTKDITYQDLPKSPEQAESTQEKIARLEAENTDLTSRISDIELAFAEIMTT